MAIMATTSIPTANDWQYAKDIKPGDWVFNRFGKPVKVKVAQVYRSEDCYRVLFDDYTSLDVDRHALFRTEDQIYRTKAREYKGKFKRKKQLILRNAEEMLDKGLLFRGNRMFFSVPTTEPVQFPHQPLGIPPFIYGFWFVSRKANRTLSAPLEFADNIFAHFKNSGYKIEILTQVYPKYIRFRTEPSIWDQLRGEQTRSFPFAYLNGSPEQRLECIQGILSARPCKKAGQAGLFTFKSSNKRISTAFQYLSESLGAKVRLYYDKFINSNDLFVYRVPPFLEQMAPKRAVVHLARRYVKSIERIPAQLCVHIETDDEDGSFLAGEGFIPCQ